MNNKHLTPICDTLRDKLRTILRENESCYCQDVQIPTYIPFGGNSKKILVLSGGGIRGIAFLGALHVLWELKILQNMSTFAGTSVGSVILFLLIIGYSPNELYEFIKIFDLNKLKSFSISLFIESFGLDSGDKIVTTLLKLMASKKFDQNITFGELHRKTQKTFIVTAVNISEHRVEYFSYKTHPELSVMRAIRMSISIPFVYAPVLYNDCTYVDGGCIDNFPLRLFSDCMSDVVGIHIVDNITNKMEIKTLEDYILNVIYSITCGITETSAHGNDAHVIKILINKTNVIDFDISTDNKKKLYDAGYKCAREYFHRLRGTA